MSAWQRFKAGRAFPYVAVALVSALVYLPHLLQLGFYRDDWYYLADGYFGGADIFHTMFWIDRPARGYLFELLFGLFGLHATYYHLLMWLWRAAAGVLGLALFQSLWPQQPRRNLLMALVFVLYPGFLWWVSGVEYQPMLLSLVLHTASIWFSILALQERPRGRRAAWLALALLSGWASLWLVDYALGMEVFRWVCIYFYCVQQPASTPRLWPRALRHSLLSLPLVGAFLFWKLFFSSGVRNETDIALQLAKFAESPLAVGAGWLSSMLRSVYNVLVTAWAHVEGHFFGLPLAQQGLALALTGLALLFILALLRGSQPNQAAPQPGWGKAAVLGGLLGIVGGALPIVIMSRTILMDGFSHYALPVSLCVALLVGGALSYLQPAALQRAAAAALLGLAVLAIHSHALSVIQEQRKVQAFWQGFAQRVPALQPDTALLVNFPGVDYGEENDIVWAPANFIYLPQASAGMQDGYVVYPYSGASLHPESFKYAQMGGILEESYRSHVLFVDFAQLLVASQPTPESCVHVMDARWPRLSAADNGDMLLAAQYSNIEQVALDAAPAQPPAVLFGPAPAEGWCSAYARAEQAVQAAEWGAVLAVLDDAEAAGYAPADRVEWLPFVQAALALGDQARLRALAPQVAADAFVSHQACQLLAALPRAGYAVDAGSHTLAETLFCSVPVPDSLRE